MTFERANVVSTEPFEIPTAEELREASKKRRDKRAGKQIESLANLPSGGPAQNSSSITNTEFDSNWKMLKPAGGSFDLLVPDDTEMVSTRIQPLSGTSVQSKVTKYEGKTRSASLRVEWVKYTDSLEPELAKQFLKVPINSLIPDDVEVVHDSLSNFQGFPARDYSIQKGEMLSFSKCIAGEKFAMIVIISFKEGRPDDISTFWDSIKINAGK